MAILIEDTFEVKELDPEGKKFDLVSRIVARGETYEMELVMDVNTGVYPIDQRDRFQIAWAKTIDLEGKPSPESFDQALCSGKTRSLMDDYEYVTYGRVYRLDVQPQQIKVAVYISYGGLLQKIVGEPQHLRELENDANVYCLVRRVVKAR